MNYATGVILYELWTMLNAERNMHYPIYTVHSAVFSAYCPI